jgi:hypothetical protein
LGKPGRAESRVPLLCRQGSGPGDFPSRRKGECAPGCWCVEAQPLLVQRRWFPKVVESQRLTTRRSITEVLVWISVAVGALA